MDISLGFNPCFYWMSEGTLASAASKIVLEGFQSLFLLDERRYKVVSMTTQEDKKFQSLFLLDERRYTMYILLMEKKMSKFQSLFLLDERRYKD